MVRAAKPVAASELPGQVVLVLQGGGASGAFQWGVYEALHERGIEPAWIIGAPIGAINAALIAGNMPTERVARLREFWRRVEQRVPGADGFDALGLGLMLSGIAILTTVSRGRPVLFAPNPNALCGPRAAVGVEQASYSSYYVTEPLRHTLSELVDSGRLAGGDVRLS